MKNLLTEKTLLWVVVLALAVSSYSLHTGSSAKCGDCDSVRRGRTSQLREKMGPKQERLFGPREARDGTRKKKMAQKRAEH